MQNIRSTRTQQNIWNTKQANNNDYGDSQVIVEKLLKEEIKAFWVAECELVNAGCSVKLYQHGCEL